MVSIGITCFDAEDTILRALQSALKQNWSPKEIIVVDDASTDGSAEIIRSCSEEHPEIMLYQHPTNLGAAGARQTILNHANGDFIVFFDDDDLSFPGRIEEQYKRIIEYENKTGEHLIACYASGTRLYPNGYEVEMKAIGSQDRIPHGKAVADRLLFYGGPQDFFYGVGTPTCSLMARKSTFDIVGGFDPNFRRVEDVDFAIRLALNGGHFIGNKEKLFVQYSTNAVDKNPDKNCNAEQQLADKYKEYLETVNRYRYAKKWPLIRYYHFKRQYFRLLCVLTELLLFYPFAVPAHFLRTAPRRILHEFKLGGD